MTYPVISSRPAKKDLAHITQRHKEILEGMAIQAEKVRQHKAEQDMVKKEKEFTRGQQQEKEMKLQNDHRTHALKQEELTIKKMALASP